jgi:hypothetical protein
MSHEYGPYEAAADVLALFVFSAPSRQTHGDVVGGEPQAARVAERLAAMLAATPP